MEAQRINDITSSHFKSLKIINNVHTDNNENNDIELVPISVANYDPSSELSESQQPTEKNTVQRLIEQFNVDELMQADQPVVGLSGYNIPDEIPKPVKKYAKKYTTDEEYQKKEIVTKSNQKQTFKKPIKPEALALEDMMLGDQAQGEPELVEHVLEDEVSNEIMEALPHRKKILPQDLKTMPSITEKHIEIATSPEALKAITEQTSAPSTTMPNLLITNIQQKHLTTTEINFGISKGGEISVHSTPAISHPIHPQQSQHLNPIFDENQHSHKKESIIDNSHFIPPMLLVKSHYVPPNKHGHEHEHEHEHEMHEEEMEHVKSKEHSEHHVHLHALPATTTATKIPTISTTIGTLPKKNQMELEKTILTTTEAVANDISVSTSQSPVRTSPGIDEHTNPTITITTTIIPIISNSNSNPIESNEEKELKKEGDDEMSTPIIERSTMEKTATTTQKNMEYNAVKINLNKYKNSNKNTTITNLSATERAAATTTGAEEEGSVVTSRTIKEETIKSVEMLESTELPELRKSATKTINSKRGENIHITKTTTPTSTIAKLLNAQITSGGSKESIEEGSEEQERYERLFASKTTPVRAKEFEANVAAAFAAASKLGQQPLLSLEARTTAASVATTVKLPIEQTQQATNGVVVLTTSPTLTSSTTTTTTTTAQSLFATTASGNVETAKTDDKIALTTNVNELESLSTIEATTTKATQTAATTTILPIIKTSIENKTINDDEQGQDIAATTRANFLWSETTTTFKPNRRRLLTKPETVGYFKKILG